MERISHIFQHFIRQYFPIIFHMNPKPFFFLKPHSENPIFHLIFQTMTKGIFQKRLQNQSWNLHRSVIFRKFSKFHTHPLPKTCSLNITITTGVFHLLRQFHKICPISCEETKIFSQKSGKLFRSLIISSFHPATQHKKTVI